MIVPVFNYHSSIITIMGKSKRLRDATIVLQTRVFSFVIKKKMKAETRFPRTVEAYKAHLHEDRPHYDSFQTFCRKQGVRYKGVMQWMHRHNRSVGSLRLEVLLEKNGNDSNLKSSLIEVSGQSFPIKNSCISSRNIPLDQYIKGAILSFPDGVSISIRETTPSALMKLFELYTQVTGNPNV